ncbi:MAG: pyridoxal phosphate-dependent aminotransferase [Oscillospiraceae bacterium]|nr:pyridoxal phosphate-dependent aminotransferase [Oscillospiraceae bacterium]
MLNEQMVGYGTARSVIRELFEYGNQRAKVVGRENIYDFSLGNPSVAPPKEVNETIRRLTDEMDPCLLHGYTSAPGDPEARERIAQSIRRRFGMEASAGELYMTVGAAAGLCCCLRGLCNPGDEVITFAPFFPEYGVFIASALAQMKVCPPRPEDFQIDFDALEGLIGPATKALIINSPNNPSGAVYTADTLRRLARLLEEKSRRYGHPIYLISDEPYREIVFSGVEVPYVPKFYANTLVCYSWSKSLSLPGERIGYVFVPGQVEDQSRVYGAVAGAGRALGYVCAPSLMQRVAAACCELTADLSVYEANARLLTRELTAMGYSCVAPGGTFYLFPRTLEADDVAFCQKARELDLLVVPGSGFACPGHMRISYCVPTERILRSLPVFRQLAQLYK